jgi:hypothetical protein
MDLFGSAVSAPGVSPIGTATTSKLGVGDRGVSDESGELPRHILLVIGINRQHRHYRTTSIVLNSQ